jgi:hypothetical protein
MNKMHRHLYGVWVFITAEVGGNCEGMDKTIAS